MDSSNKVKNTKPRTIIYVAIMDDEQLLGLIGKAEEYLIFKLQNQLMCNTMIKKQFKLKELSIVNSGELPSGLPENIECTT